MANPNVLAFLVIITCVGVNCALLKKQHSEIHPSHNNFAADVYEEVIKQNNESFAVCPLSAHIILALTHSGARENTAEELASALRLPNEREEIHGIFTALKPHIHGDERYSLSSANKIYVKDGFHIKDSFKKTAEDVFAANVQSIDFENNQAAVKEMNEWVEKQTHEKIKDLVSEADIDKDTMSVLINAMFFEAKWEVQFDKERTHKMDFHKNEEEKVETDFMSKTAMFWYYESTELNAKFLKLPYEGDDVHMTFVLPSKKGVLSTLEENITDIFEEPQYEIKKVHVEIPKFTIKSTINFNDILTNLGVHDAFTNTADFGDLLEEVAPLKISTVLQKTFVEVTETGTTAAAATEVLISLGSMPMLKPPPVMEFVADHPFIFYIKIKDVVFFVGRYSSP